MIAANGRDWEGFQIKAEILGEKTMTGQVNQSGENLAVATLTFVYGSFCYYLMIFALKNLPGNILTNIYASTVGDIIGLMIPHDKNSLILANLITCSASLTYFLYQDPVLLLPIKLGISASLAQSHHHNIFIEIIGRSLTIFAPLVADVEPIGAIFALSCAVVLVQSLTKYIN